MKSAGTFFLVVGASGVGKDALLTGAKAALAGDGRFVFAQRVITRPADAGGEDHRSATPQEFAAMQAAGGFLTHWSAHGLSYGLPIALADELAAGRHVVANGSRAAVGDIAGRVENLVVVEITAPDGLVRARLETRGRESAAEISARAERQTPSLPGGVEVVRVANDADLQTGIERLIEILETHCARPFRIRAMAIDTWHDKIAYIPADSAVVQAEEYLGPGRVDIFSAERSTRARVHVVEQTGLLASQQIGLSRSAFEALGLPEGARVRIRHTPSPESVEALRSKIGGAELSEAQYRMLIQDIVEDRYPDREVAAFLASATGSLSDAEVLALTRVRLAFAPRMTWDEPIVVDKHSLGGIPGSRITLIVVPIIAAHGLAIPKTSSRAITSAAGTADAMETVARVDLAAEDVHRVVAEARGCIAWNGRLNHSVVDDVMNAITRPLGIDSNRWSVASILSKKVAAGSTHVAIDLPFGPRAKLKTQTEAEELGRLFESIGAQLGLTVAAHATAGRGPIGDGIGPALEVRDVRRVLANDRRAPQDLREKALFFAAQILSWDSAVGSLAKARGRAEQLLHSGAALKAFERIIDAQGRREQPVGPGRFMRPVKATRSGIVTEINSWTIAGIARRAGAPMDKSAGVDLLCREGTDIRAGDPLYLVHAGSETDLATAVADAEHDSGYSVA
jgi:thymidine phosphorylase